MLSPPTMTELCGRFFAAIPQHTILAASDLPQPYQTLLAHTNHMTVTVEKFYSQLVDVHVLATVHDADSYSRKILLKTQDDGRIVQFGIVLIDLPALSETVRREIVAGDTPLGRVLIQNNVLTRVEPVDYLRVIADAEFAEWFSIPLGTVLYGRLGVIYAADARAVEVLEVLTPV